MCTTFIVYLRGYCMMLQRLPLGACLSLFVLICACVHSLAFVCTFPVLTGWPAAVLESLLTESVGSAGYFYPLACVSEQVEALWATTRSHSDKQRYATICSCSGQNVEVWVPVLQSHSMQWSQMASQGERRSFLFFFKQDIQSMGKKCVLKLIFIKTKLLSNLELSCSLQFKGFILHFRLKESIK